MKLLPICTLFAVFVSTFGGFFGRDDDNEYEESTTESTVWNTESISQPDVCVPAPLGGVEWILSQRQSDYGWKEDTHRAVIALALNGWGPANAEDIRQMELQLEVELTKVWLQNRTTPMYPNDIALYVHALIATRRNPRDFHGVDLVAMLQQSVASRHQHQVHPFLLLALCNADALAEHHAHKILAALQRYKASNAIEHLALALNAYECAGSRGHEIDDDLAEEVRNKLIERQQEDGSFGNVYVTSKVVQALASKHWSNKQKALEYLKEQSTVDANMVSTYLIQMALKAEKVNFIKDLHPDLKLGPAAVHNTEDDHFIQYTIRVGKRPDVYFTISIKVPPNNTFFDVMKLSAEHDSKFNFSYNIGIDKKPVIYSISGVANDAEEQMFWKLCRQTDIDHNRHKYKMQTIYDSPITLIPNRDDHVLYWYRKNDCDAI